MRDALSVLFFCLVFSPSLYAARTRIDTVEPGTVRLDAKDDMRNVFIITGKGLNGVYGCTLTPVRTSANGSDVQESCGKSDYIRSSGQSRIAVRISHTWNSGNLLLTLTDKKGRTLAVVTLQAIGGAGQDAPATASSAPGSSSQISPFTTCINGNVSSSSLLNPPSGSDPPQVNCSSSLLSEGEVKDNFGQHVAHTYYALQVRISDDNSSYDFLLRDIMLTLPDGRVISGRVRRFAQGVVVKGKTLDRRAAWYNTLQASSGLYGVLTTFASTGFKTAGNIISGSVLAGFAQVFPDYTADNVNRFNNAVFDDQSPAVVPKKGIGQPPLYVVALVPKDRNSSEAYAKRIAVSLEGAYIRQVSLVTLSTTSLVFPSTYISPDQLAGGNLAPFTATELDDFRKTGPERSFSISNQSTSPMNITKIELKSDGKSSSVLTSTIGDFSFDRTKSDCGKTPNVDFDPNTAFTLAPQSSCTVTVQFHPAGISDSSATITLEGASLDGARSVSLTGKSVGLIVNTHGITFENTDAPAPVHPEFKCIESSPCQLDMQMVGSHTALNVPVAVVGADTTGVLIAGSATTNGNCNDLTESQIAQAKAIPITCSLSINLPPDENSASVNLSSIHGWKESLSFSYQTVQPKITVTLPNEPVTEGDATQAISVTVTQADGKAMIPNTTGGITVNWRDLRDLTGTKGTLTPDPNANGKYPIKGLNAGKYAITASFAASGSYAHADSGPQTLLVTGPAVLTLSAASATLRSGSPQSISVRAATAGGTVCSGSINFTPKTPLIPDTQLDSNGTAVFTITVPSGTAAAAAVPGEFDYITAAGDLCTPPASGVSFSYTIAQ